MAWVAFGQEVKRLREMLGWSIRELDQKSGISERQLRKIESKNPPSTTRAESIRAIARALHKGIVAAEDLEDEVREQGCVAKDIARWVDRFDVEATPPPSGIRIRPRLPPRRRVPDSTVDDLQPFTTLNRRAQAERRRGVREWIEESREQHELFGLDHMARVFSRPKKYDGRRFAVVGIVDDSMGVIHPAEGKIGASPGDGARFRLTRTAFDGKPFYATVFTRTIEEGDLLEKLLDRDTAVALLARVVYIPPDDHWRGFMIFEDDPRPRAWALVVERQLDSCVVSSGPASTAA